MQRPSTAEFAVLFFLNPLGRQLVKWDVHRLARQVKNVTQCRPALLPGCQLAYESVDRHAVADIACPHLRVATLACECRHQVFRSRRMFATSRRQDEALRASLREPMGQERS